QHLAMRVHFSSAYRNELEALCLKANITYHTIKRTVSTRWNTYGTLFDSLVNIDKPVKSLCAKHDELPTLTASDWTIIRQLNEVLKPFIDFTNEMSDSQQPLIHEVIPLMDQIYLQLEDLEDDLHLLPTVRMGIKAGLKILDKYYARTDDSLMYRAAMSKSSFSFSSWISLSCSYES
ncbi:hypothetical protein K435DRAFT_666757, partial [Dendrothele bispora CBS 962.96]